ncbi:hypothetical protein [Halegenticoccus tardaugens]|uniref:hypothetical protein n=1 Tax=Halegenticoccus tardaugens TaxID=2071624 RepID=UPI0037423F1E
MTRGDREQLTDTLDVSASLDEEATLSAIKRTIEAGTDADFASVGTAIRNDLAGELDAELLERELSNLAAQIQRLPEVREAGIPGGEKEPAVLYRDIAEPGWHVYDHLLDVGFFESADANSPRFAPELIKNTAHELIRADPLTADLTDVGFDEREQLALVMNVTNNDLRLARWVPTKEIPDGVEFNVEFVPPLHQRAMGGALLWIKTLDVHLWQKSVLITDRILDDAIWDVKAMLGGLYLLTKAALEVAEGEHGSLTDSQLTAALTAGAAITIINQEELCRDAFYITEEMRAPSRAR